MPDVDYAGRTVVAGAGGKIALPGKSLQFVRCENIGDLVDEAWDRYEAGVTVVHRDALEAWGLPTHPPRSAAATDTLARNRFMMAAAELGYQVEVKSAYEISVRSPAGGAWRRVFVPAWDLGEITGPWGRIESFEELVRGLSRFAHTTGLAWVGSTGRTAERLILSTHPRGKVPAHILPAAIEVPTPALDGGLEQPYTWRRRLQPAELEAACVHHVDLNAAYLAAWGTVELGLGEPEYFPHGVEFSKSRPGLWRLDRAWLDDTAGEASYEAPRPMPLNLRSDWVTTPTLTRIYEVWPNRLPDVAEAFIWPHASRYLRAAAERLRDARAQLLGDASEAARVALSAVQALYRVETGRFNMAARDERSPWHRPDWGHFVRAQARVNLHRRLDKLHQLPFAITTDDMLFASDEPNVDIFAKSIDLPWGPGLGQFKAKATVAMPDVAEVLGKDGSALAAMNAMREVAGQVFT